MLGLAAASAGGQLGHEAGRHRQLEPEGERHFELGAARLLGVVEQRQVAAEQVVGGQVGLGRVEQPQHRVAGAGAGGQRRAGGAQARVAVDRRHVGHRHQVAAAFVQDQVEPEERLQAAAEARLRFARALGDRAEAAPRLRVEMEDPVRLAVADAAQHDRLRLYGLSGHEIKGDRRTGRRSAYFARTAARTFAQLHLAAGAEVGGAAADDDADDLTAAGRAGLALAGVDEELVLHRPLLAAAVAVVVDRGAAVVDPGLQGGDDGVAQRLQVLGLHRAGGRERVQAGPVERLVGVDVADAGDPGLVEQERLQRRRAPGGHRSQRLRRELGRERLDADLAGEARLEVDVVDQEGLAEAARVGEPDLATVVEDEAGAQVAGRGRALGLVQPPSLRGVEHVLALDQDQVAGHPQMHDQRLAAVQRQQQVLAAPPQPLDRAPADRGAQLRPAAPAATSARPAPPATRSGALPAPARAGARRSRPRAAPAFPSSTVSAVDACMRRVSSDTPWQERFSRRWPSGGR